MSHDAGWTERAWCFFVPLRRRIANAVQLVGRDGELFPRGALVKTLVQGKLSRDGYFQRLLFPAAAIFRLLFSDSYFQTPILRAHFATCNKASPRQTSECKNSHLPRLEREKKKKRKKKRERRRKGRLQRATEVCHSGRRLRDGMATAVRILSLDERLLDFWILRSWLPDQGCEIARGAPRDRVGSDGRAVGREPDAVPRRRRSWLLASAASPCGIRVGVGVEQNTSSLRNTPSATTGDTEVGIGVGRAE
ncbi:hypothetical protein JHW43_004906 [Diplocarpon mali]|nr:hypothetical protein JHW43_004906 [Diplocarpon mali]